MDFSHFDGDIPIIDAHVHFSHPRWMDDIISLMQSIPLGCVNLVSTPHPRFVNFNPALIYAKARYPDRFYLCGGLDYTQALADRDRMSASLAAQIEMLKTAGFDGLKLIEGKPTARKHYNISLDAPEYEGMWATLEALDFPIVWHVADPETFWDPDLVPSWARDNDWFYGDGSFPAKEALYAEVDRVLERHPTLKVVLAHFYFLSADLERASRFLDAHPTVCFDLTPGGEMYNNFTRHGKATRAFFIRYQDRLIYGTDTNTWAIERNGIDEPLSYAWVVRTFLESDELFSPPDLIPHWLEPDLEGLQGIALPRAVLVKIYSSNFKRLFGSAPAPLRRAAATAELERLADAIDALGGDGGSPNLAREVIEMLESEGAS